MTVTTQMNARPVWARRERRLFGEELGAPTDVEMYDAIRVLEAGITFPLSLYAEAEAIMREAHEGRVISTVELLRDVSEDFLDDWQDRP